MTGLSSLPAFFFIFSREIVSVKSRGEPEFLIWDRMYDPELAKLHPFGSCAPGPGVRFLKIMSNYVGKRPYIFPLTFVCCECML